MTPRWAGAASFVRSRSASCSVGLRAARGRRSRAWKAAGGAPTAIDTRAGLFSSIGFGVCVRSPTTLGKDSLGRAEALPNRRALALGHALRSRRSREPRHAAESFDTHSRSNGSRQYAHRMGTGCPEPSRHDRRATRPRDNEPRSPGGCLESRSALLRRASDSTSLPPHGTRAPTRLPQPRHDRDKTMPAPPGRQSR